MSKLIINLGQGFWPEVPDGFTLDSIYDYRISAKRFDGTSEVIIHLSPSGLNKPV